jgi:hypothetical protein
MSIRLVLGYHHVSHLFPHSCDNLQLTSHECVVLLIRPLVMCVLHMQLERGQIHETRGITLSPPVESLIHSFVESAQAILRILRILADEELIGKIVSTSMSHFPKL